MNKAQPILTIKDSCFRFDESGFYINNLNLEINSGEFLGLVGESGSGKSTIGKLLACLYNKREQNGLAITQGNLNYTGDEQYDGKNLFDCTYKELVPFRKQVQYLFQNHRAAVHRNMTVKQTMMEAANIKYPELSKSDRFSIVRSRLSDVGLLDQTDTTYTILEKKSRDLSGGQIKRLAIGRTLLMDPKVLIADEPLTGLDASRKGRVLKYLTDVWKKRLKTDNPLTIVLISHDIGMVLRLSKRVMVIYGDLYSKSSQIVEDNVAQGYSLNEESLHPYTNSLLATTHYFKTGESSQLHANTISGNSINSNNGCKYVSFCPEYIDECEKRIQVLKKYKHNESHRVACSVLNP